ncbi:MAG: class I SAM-dependent methyltransferase, partial [Chloroflexota bacterium]
MSSYDGAAALACAVSRMVGTDAWRLDLWDGRTVALDTEEHFRITLHRKAALDRLLGAFPERAFGRAYADDLLDIAPLDAFLDAISHTTFRQKAGATAMLMRAALALGARPSIGTLRSGEARLQGRRHSRDRDAAAVRHHYDLPVEFYELWLDSSLTYSCAYFDDPKDDIDTAQRAKLDLVCRKLR